MKTVHLDFNNPADARKFLKDFRLPNGAKILEVILKNKKTIPLHKATDEQVMQFASQIYNELYSEGVGYCKEEQTSEYLH